MRGGDTGAGGAYVQGLREFDKLNAQSVRTPQKDRDLYSNAWALPLLGGGHRFLSLQNLTRHLAHFSTVELVRSEHPTCQSQDDDVPR